MLFWSAYVVLFLHCLNYFHRDKYLTVKVLLQEYLPRTFEPEIPRKKTKESSRKRWKQLGNPSGAVRRLMNTLKVDGLTRALTRQLFFVLVLSFSFGFIVVVGCCWFLTRFASSPGRFLRVPGSEPIHLDMEKLLLLSVSKEYLDFTGKIEKSLPYKILLCLFFRLLFFLGFVLLLNGEFPIIPFGGPPGVRSALAGTTVETYDNRLRFSVRVCKFINKSGFWTFPAGCTLSYI